MAWFLLSRPVHLAARISDQGEISPACVKKPKALDPATDDWTIDRRAVTCPKCIAKLEVKS